MLTTSRLLKVVNRLFPRWLSKPLIHRLSCCKLFQQVGSKFANASSDKPDFNRLDKMQLGENIDKFVATFLANLVNDTQFDF